MLESIAVNNSLSLLWRAIPEKSSSLKTSVYIDSKANKKQGGEERRSFEPLLDKILIHFAKMREYQSPQEEI